MRWFVMRYAVLSTCFWTVAIGIAAWLVHWEMNWLVWVLGAVWAYLSLPGVAVQLLLIADLVLYALTGRIAVYPAFLAQDRDKPHEQGQPPQGRTTRESVLTPAFRFAADVSPLIALATWALVVLARMPVTAHVAATEPVEHRSGAPEKAGRDIRAPEKAGRRTEAPGTAERRNDRVSEQRPERAARSEVKRAIRLGRKVEGNVYERFARMPFAGV